MDKHGYIFTTTGGVAFAVYEEYEQVRYAAELDDGSGFAAYDGSLAKDFRFDRYELSTEPHEDYPDSWPWREAPKRRISNGRERFSTMTWARVANLMADPLSVERVTGLVQLPGEYDEGGLWLVETDGLVPVATWTAGIKTAVDRRILSTTGDTSYNITVSV